MALLMQHAPASVQQALQALVPPMDGGKADLLLSLYIGVGVLFVRLAAEAVVLPAFRHALKPYVSPERLNRTAFKVFENAFTCSFSGSLAVWAWYVTLRDNGGCTPFHTKPCLSMWPDVPLTSQFQLVWLSIAGYYTYEMIGTALRLGGILQTEMVVHHVITMVMMVSAGKRGGRLRVRVLRRCMHVLGGAGGPQEDLRGQLNTWAAAAGSAGRQAAAPTPPGVS
jgi:ceramide synthetase